MVTVAAALAAAARQCSLGAPVNGWAAATTAGHIELRDDFLRETVDDILSRVDVPQPISAVTTITGTGVEEYALPAAFLRVHRNRTAVYEATLNRRPCTPVMSDGDWEYLQEFGAAGAERYYRIKGYDGNFTIDFFSPLETGSTVKVAYVSTGWMKSAAGVQGADFTVDTDVLLLPRPIVETGIVWRFRARKGMPFADKNAAYEAQLIRLQNDGKGYRTISYGHQPRSLWDIPVPDVLTGDV